jgi:hypothetical protein
MLSADLRRTITHIVRDKNREVVDFLQQRANVAALVQARAEGGKVALVESGMDCDCVRYENSVSLVPAIPIVVLTAMERRYYNAEGPVSVRVERPSIAAELCYSARDLALEAFEDGHAHVVSSVRFDEEG